MSKIKKIPLLPAIFILLIFNNVIYSADALAADQKKYLDSLVKQLNANVGDPKYPERMRLIKIAIEEHGIHPDSIRYGMDLVPEKPLWESVKLSDMEGTQFLLQHHADPNQYRRYWDKNYPLISQVKTRPMAELLLKAGAKIEYVRDPRFMSSIITHGKDVELISLYVECGGNLDGTNKDGNTPLQQLFDFRHYSMASKLIALGASLDILCASEDCFRGLTCIERLKKEIKKETAWRGHPIFAGDKRQLLAKIQKAGQERQHYIRDSLPTRIPINVIGLMLEYYEKEKFQ